MMMMGVMGMRMTYMLLHRRHDWTVGLSGSQSENEENEYIEKYSMINSFIYRVNVFQGVVGWVSGVNLKWGKCLVWNLSNLELCMDSRFSYLKF